MVFFADVEDRGEYLYNSGKDTMKKIQWASQITSYSKMEITMTWKYKKDKVQ